MELDRKAFHFDLDNKSVERFYPIALKSHNIQGMNRLKISSCPINAPMAP